MATALAAAGIVLLDNAQGRLMVGVAAAVLLALSLHGTLVRPRLTADPTGVTVRSLTGSRHWSWGEVNVRLVRTRRLGRDVAVVELDAENSPRPGLVLLGRLELGVDPEDVADVLLTLRT